MGDNLVAKATGQGQEAMNVFLISSELKYHVSKINVMAGTCMSHDYLVISKVMLFC